MNNTEAAFVKLPSLAVSIKEDNWRSFIMSPCLKKNDTSIRIVAIFILEESDQYMGSDNSVLLFLLYQYISWRKAFA